MIRCETATSAVSTTAMPERVVPHPALLASVRFSRTPIDSELRTRATGPPISVIEGS